ncbi:hypothetical protein JIN85_05720 [Luteolibacter pohnpeiensis]|uniref:Mandelate racemase/muconate lactonizing enzyme C-terminal domain-containing protein n=1 Tax=Luteolibacter pohnpeiensis TaxID=454153 RepID=A0A934VTW3_9BACT|nr:enolase C-terminal domain-like protein [Luteolibacter pohnpeiensis]MBK1881902.1 hypothetical protein [Luteolibacter pohnpeiensis]
MILPTHQKPLVARYRMRSRGFLNAISRRREFEGALIRVGDGFGCIHPWPELGDPSLEKCLEDLQGPQRYPIVRRALRCAEYDQVARQASESLFEEMEVPRSHATLTSSDAANVNQAVDAGFDMIKLKAGHDLEKEADFLELMSQEYPQLKWRIDFNESADAEAVRKFLLGLPEKVRRAIDFLEDPCPYSDEVWKNLNRQTRVNLAVDRESAPQSKSAQVMVIKPAVDEPYLLGEAALQNSQRAILTSYMDHPLGQAFAAWEAARLELQLPGLVGVCGLQTHHLFEPDEASEQLGAWKPEFTIPDGTGLGFDDYLDALPWTRLY